MEIGSHDRLEEGVLNQDLSNGLKLAETERNICEEVRDEAREQHQHNFPDGARYMSQTPDWVPAAKSSNPESQQGALSVQNINTSVKDVGMEDAQNLVDFSTSVGSVQSYTNNQSSQTCQLYERFNQEMSKRGEETRQENASFPPEDLNTLQAALSKARHGHKPPNCDCDGPDCPDYLEWLEKQIKMVTKCQDKSSCTLSVSTPQQDEQHHCAQMQQCGSKPLPVQDAISQPQVNKPPATRPYGPLPPIPCSPTVLSIAKERNVSLQTAIAIEALTQLSATVPQTVVPPGESSPANHHHHLPTSFAQSISQVVSSSGPPLSTSASFHYPQQQQRPKFQGETATPNNLHHFASPHPISKSPVTSMPSSLNVQSQRWNQGTASNCVKSPAQNSWMTVNTDSQQAFVNPPQGRRDHVSELKQLLGDSCGKASNSGSMFPLPHPSLQNGHLGSFTGMPHIKQEVDTNEYLDQERMLNGQHVFPGQQFSNSIRNSTQAALQQHLHHKRNLFQNSQAFGSLGHMACQNLRKWWPHTNPESPVAIKQEHKEPKKKKTAQSSPLLKQQMGGLFGSPGASLPKPKQIVIKKHKQKASQPTFLPQKQIAISKAPFIPPGYVSSLSQLIPSLPGMEAGLPCSQGAESHPATTQSQESLSNCSSAHSSECMDSSNPVSVQATSKQNVLVPAGSKSSIPAISTPNQTSITQPSPSLSNLSNLDPKFEELIRQFEEEFGDTGTSSSASENCPVRAAVTGSQPNSGQAKTESLPSMQTNNCHLVPTTESESMEEGQKDINETKKETTLLPPEEFCTIKQNSVKFDVVMKPSESQDAVAEQHHPFATPFSPPSKRIKIESSNGVTVLSTNACFSADRQGDDLNTPTKEIFPSSPSLKGFLESPLRYLDTPTKSLLNTPVKEGEPDFPTCDCLAGQSPEREEGPYYNHLGSGRDLASVRELMEGRDRGGAAGRGRTSPLFACQAETIAFLSPRLTLLWPLTSLPTPVDLPVFPRPMQLLLNRYGEKGEAVRIEKVIYTGREGKSTQGCPIAKWVIRRSSEKEKLLCVVKQRPGHHCENTVIVVVILAWEGLPNALADKLYREVTQTITKYGNATSRRCGLNEDRTCACQGKDPETCGASFSFGCSWSMYFNGCKYARSKTPRKFRLHGEHPEEEENLRDNFQILATQVAPLYKKLAPQAYSNQCLHEDIASDCRLGLKAGRPFSGITACMDFCAHAHKDQHNLHNGCTVVCTLTKEENRIVGSLPEDEQLHVLPLYKISPTDEFGSEENQRRKMQTGALQMLTNFRREVRKLPEPAKSCRQRRLEAKKAASEKKNKKLQLTETPVKTIKMEMNHMDSPNTQQGNKAIPKQEVKPIIKKEPVNHFQPLNGAIPSYPVLGNGKTTPSSHKMKSSFSSGDYARGRMPTNSQPPAQGPVFHPNLQDLHYGYYNYPPNGLYSPGVMGYDDGHSNRAFDQKPDIQHLQAKLAQVYPRHTGQQQMTDSSFQGYSQTPELPQSPAPQSHTPSVTHEQTNYSTPIVKQEPMDVPLYDGRLDGQAQSCPNTPNTTPNPEAWAVNKSNGSLVSKGWDGNRPGSNNSPFTPDMQRLHQQSPHQQAQYPQQRQWNSYSCPNTPMPSSSPSPSAGPSPAPSPHLASHRQWGSPAPSPQPKSWGAYGPMGYGAGSIRQGHPAGAFPDKMLSQESVNCGSAPLGLQEKAWKSSGGSAAGSTPSPAPEGRLFPDALQRPDNQACWDSGSETQSQHDPDEEEVWSDSEHNFLDPNIGGVAVAPMHGSILIECARRELHATTPLKKPDRTRPSRISLVFYQHKNLNQPCHGLAIWEAKMKILAERAQQRQQEAALLGLSQEEMKAYAKKRKWAAGATSQSPGQSKDKREGVVTRMAPTQNTNSIVTVSPYPSTQLTGPYSRFV
ncbi:hypothetical protein DNTS_018844 [Danionella cerebrum]|uniref:Methylcytosine dioxygenase TET n=1 Tax=Danionella cerebrum TaxID=2873325 RepID=A0A553QMK0_9TELE|nr:hypothetical protein DNTS_018844 [Danionella translucida]